MDGAQARLVAEGLGDGADTPVPNGDEISSEYITSVDDLAELILSDHEAKRTVIRLGGLSGSEPTDHATVLAERLLARHGTELAVRKIVDAGQERAVVDKLRPVLWRGKETSYLLAEPGDEPGALREAALCLTTLIVAHLEKGAKGVDSVASSTPLLKVCENTSSHAGHRTIVSPNTRAMIEQIAGSDPSDVFVVLGNDLVAMPERAANALVAQWPGWMQVAKDRDFNIDRAVALTPCLPAGAQSVVAGHVRNGSTLRLLATSDAPRIQEVAYCLSQLPREHSKLAAERLHTVLFADRYDRVEGFLIECLGTLAKGGSKP